MIWIIVFGFVIAALLVTLGYVIGSGMQHEKVRDALESAKVEREAKNLAIDAKNEAIRDLATVHAALAEARKNEATWRTATGKVTADYSNLMAERDELQRQLSEVVYEVKPNVAVDVATDPPKEVQFIVKTPRRRTRAGQTVNDVPSHTPPVGGTAQLERNIEPQ